MSATRDDEVPPIGQQADEATAITRMRMAVEQAQQDNDRKMAEIFGRHPGAGLNQLGVTNVRLHELVEMLLGGMDSPRRLEYEAAVQARFATMLGELDAELTKRKLVQRINGDPRLRGHGGPGGGGLILP